MMTRYGLALLLTGAAAAGCCGQALAKASKTGPIGGAAVIEREVSGSLGRNTRNLASGDDVFSNELIRTHVASSARFVFKDDTRLAVGPTSQVKLDRFVYNPDSTARVATVRAVRGAFRWVSGASDHRAYQIRTPLATIGVRGTIFDLVVARGRTTVVLQEGAVIVCPNGSRRCAVMNQPGQVVNVTPRGMEGPSPGGPGESEFANNCLRSPDLSGCIITAQAGVPPGGPPTGPSPADIAPIIQFGLGVAPMVGGHYHRPYGGAQPLPTPGRAGGGQVPVPSPIRPSLQAPTRFTAPIR